jgi:GntR family transcriptional regulator/MocR family aminotransferase
MMARTRRGLGATLLPISLDRTQPAPLQRQLFEQLREIILVGRVSPGVRLPSTRALARELGCSRNTVIGAYDQLYGEGYVEGESGSGTYVSSVLPEDLLGSRPPPASARPFPEGAGRADVRTLSERGRRLAATRGGISRRHAAFTPGLPETSQFPWDVWSRLSARAWREPTRVLLRHGEPGGYRPLREAIAAYLRAMRGVACGWEQVLITTGGQQCTHIAAMAVTDPGDSVWIEEPGYAGLRGPLIAGGLRLAPVPVDKEGMSLTKALLIEPRARLAVITPSRQYPLGITMSLARRLQFLDWAAENGGYILEDDYDSEYRFSGRPLSALQGLDRAGRVIYAGSFSKVLFPSLRLGYLVVPEGLAEPITRLRQAVDDHPSALAQPILATFFEEGHFAAHVRRMRRLYQSRQHALLNAAETYLAGLLELTPADAGMHLVASLAPPVARRMNDLEASGRAETAGISTPPLSRFFMNEPRGQGLLLGYAAVPEPDVEERVAGLARALQG